MQNEFTYMLCIAGGGLLITFLVRAAPFILFSGSGKGVPPWVEKFGAASSPVIIAALVVYSYSGLEWRAPWPYLAGFATVVLHLLWKNPLASIVSGTALYMVLLAIFCSSGCASAPAGELEYGPSHPLLRISRNGLLFQDRFTTPREAVELLEKHKVPKSATIHILIDEDYTDARAPWVFQHNYLGKAGYRKTILVHARKAEARAVEPGRPASSFGTMRRESGKRRR